MIKKITRYKLHHILFWILYYLFWVMAYQSMYNNIYTLMQVTVVYLIGHSGMFYTTQYLLLPRLLHKYNFGAFVTGFLLAAMFFSVIMFFAMGFVFTPEQIQDFQANSIAFITYLLTSNVFVGGLLVGAKSVIDNYKNRRLHERLKREQLETELHYLKAQVNPHFLFNTINSVYVLIKLDPDKAANTLIKLSELLRAQLYEFGDQEIPIEKEIDYLDNYIELEKTRKGDSVKVEFIKNNNLSDFKIAPLLLIPFLENCFKFVPNGKNTNNLVKVELGIDQGSFKASFYNTKDENYLKSGVGGIGLRNINRRLELIYPNRHELAIMDKPKEFLVDLTINLHER